MAPELRREILSRRSTERERVLWDREREILALVALRNEEIAL